MPFLIFAILVRIFANPFSNVFQKKLTLSGIHPVWVTFASFFLLSILCIIPSLSIDWRKFGIEFWMYCATSGIFSVFGNGLLVRALQLGDLSVLGPVNSYKYKPIVSLIMGFFLLGEIPGIGGLAGVVMIILGSYFVLGTMSERFTWTVFLRKEIQFRLWAMVLTAIEAVFIKKIIALSDVTVSFVVWCWFGALFSLLFLRIFRLKPLGRIRDCNGRTLSLFFALALTVGVTQWTTNFVFERMNVGYALALFQLSSVVSVLLGWRIFEEKQIGKKLIGGIILIIGAAIIILVK